VSQADDASVRTVLVAVAANLLMRRNAELTAVYIGPRRLLVRAHVVPVDGADLTAGVGRLRDRLLSLPAIAAVEVTPVAPPG
jgi:hypothetical protein